VDIWRQIRPATKLTRMLSIDDLFRGRHFDQEIIILCVRFSASMNRRFLVADIMSASGAPA
jgi:hypothetical protein